MNKILKFKDFLNENSKIYENISDIKRNDD